MTTDASTTRRRRPCTCTSGHLNHFSRAAAVRCDLGRGADVAAKRFRAIFRPIPDDERDPLERRVERGRIDWGAVWRGFVVPALGVVAALGAIVVVVSLEGALQYAVVQLVVGGHDDILLAALAAVVLVGVSVPVVRRPRVRKALHWLREAYS